MNIFHKHLESAFYIVSNLQDYKDIRMNKVQFRSWNRTKTYKQKL